MSHLLPFLYLSILDNLSISYCLLFVISNVFQRFTWDFKGLSVDKHQSCYYPSSKTCGQIWNPNMSNFHDVFSVHFSAIFKTIFFSFSLYFWLYTPIFSALHRLRLYPWFELWAHLGFARNFFLFSQYFIDILKTRLSLTMGHSYSYLKKIHSIFLCSTLFMFLPQ